MNATTTRGSLLTVLAYVLVGASFTANSVLGHYPYAGGQFLRYGLACLLLVPFVGRGAAGRLRGLGARAWLRLALLAAVGMVGFNLAVLAAERTAEPAVPGVLVGCAPVVVAVLVPLLDGRRPQRQAFRAALLVAFGAFAVQGWGRTDASGLAFSVCALAGEVGFAVLAGPVLSALGPRLLTAAVCALAAVEAAVAGAVLDGGAWLRRPGATEAAALLWQAAVVTVVGFVCWYMGVQRIGTERATLFTGLVPLTAVCTAPLVGTGSYGPAQAVGGALVGAGVALGTGTLPRPGHRSATTTRRLAEGPSGFRPRAGRTPDRRAGGRSPVARALSRLSGRRTPPAEAPRRTVALAPRRTVALAPRRTVAP
ncbi:DMT family transporter, partial [Streptomyces sp900105755]|uniref:DMT family transporter n=1 Tax=Streptomyces sp. 900105755 TaxID=3154389 RepID=UPI00332EA567